MRKPDSQPILRFYSFLSKLIPVLSDRFQAKYKVRLYINYFMESLVLIATMVSVCFAIKFDIGYLNYALFAVRLLLYLFSFKLNVIDVAILTKIIIIVTGFSQMHRQYLYLEAILLVFHFLFTFILALSCEQRRGDFDERLGVKIPFAKEAVVVTCAFFVHAIPTQFINIYYPTLIFAILHSFLCWQDGIYNFHVKITLQGFSLFGLTIISILATLKLTSIDTNAVLMMGTITYFIIFAWFLNRSQFSQFKILEENPNSFAEWDYMEYFQKLIYLSKEKGEQCNEEILRGFYKSHHLKCFSSQCPIRYCKEIEKQGKNEDVYYELELDIIITYIEAFLKGQLEIATIKYPNLKRFYIFYTSPSLEALRYCDKTNFIEFREAERIEIMFQSKDIQFQRENSQVLLNQLKMKIEEYINYSNQMWRLLYDENVDLERLEMIGTQLLELKDIILRYQKYSSVDISTLKIIKDFKEYLLEEKVDKSLKYEEEETSKLYNFIEIHTKEQPIVIISAQPETLERIENVNASCCRLVGYSKKELLSRKLNDILPEFIGNFHTILLTQRSKELLYKSEKKLQTSVYIVQRSGYLFEASLRILQLNSMKGRRWSCIITPTNQPNIVIVTNGEGLIQGLTSNAYPIGLDLNILGKPLCPKIFHKLLKNDGGWLNVDNHLEPLFEKKEDIERFREMFPKIKLNANMLLNASTTFLVFMLEVDSRSKTVYQTKFLRSDRSMKSIRSSKQPLSCNPKNRWTFNFPNTYSNINRHSKIDIKEKKQEHYQFVDFGEGINEMRYLNGEIQYKEDKSESSFEKEETEGSLVEIIEFNMKKEVYTDLMAATKDKLPLSLVEFSVWASIAGVLLIGAMLFNFLMFYLSAVTHKTYAYVSSDFNILRFQYSSITHSAIQLAYMSYGSFTPSFQMSIQNITSKLSTISSLSPALSVNESYINAYSFSTAINPSTSFYDILSEFKLQASNILNNPSRVYDFNTSSPVFKIMNLSVNYIDKGFEQIIDDLLVKYQKDVEDDFQTYVIIGASLGGVLMLICLRVYFLVRRMNSQRMKLLSIYLEIEESTIKNILERNNSFKAMLKYSIRLDRDEDEGEEVALKIEEEQKEARKRIKSIGKYNYFVIFFICVAIFMGGFSVNLYYEISYKQMVNKNLEQIVYFAQANFVDFNTYSLLNYVMVVGESNFVNLTVAQYLQKELMNIYRTQMRFRKITLEAFNGKLFSTSYADFFMSFWFKNACEYLSNPNCPTDFGKVLVEGGDKYWIVFTLIMDAFISIVKAFTPLPPGLFIYLAPYLEDIRKAVKFYGEDILRVAYNRLIKELIQQIDLLVIKKIWVFGAVLLVVVIGLIVYFSYLLKRMRVRSQRLEEIIGLIPYSKLSGIIEFKKYIRKKFAEEDS